MKNRFQILEFHICAFNLHQKLHQASLEKYPRRLCVFDNETKKVVDINQKLQYDYIKIMSGLYSDLDESFENKRIAVFPTYPYLDGLDSSIIKEATTIVKNLGKGKTYPDGNKVLTNEQYLECVYEEQQLENKKSKVKKIGKKQK